MKAEVITKRAGALVSGSRAVAYGDVIKNHQRIADLWNGILRAAGKLGAPLDPHDVANMMEGLKIARRYCGPINDDNYIDGAGYAAVAGEIASRMQKSRWGG